VAFTARQTKLTPDDDPAHEAKYVNSPETPIFTKGNLLFNLDRARTAVGAGKPFVIKAGLEVRFLTLAGSDKVDPDLLFLERGLAAYEEVKKHALSAVAFACRTALPQAQKSSPEQRARAAQTVVELISASESGAGRAHLLNEAAGYLGLFPNVLQQEFDGFMARQGRANASRASNSPGDENPVVQSHSTAHSSERDLLMLCLHFETLGKRLSSSIPHDWIDTSHPAGLLLNRFLAEFEHDTWPGRDHLDGLLETPEERSLVATIIFEAPEIEDPVKVATEGLKRLRARALEPRLRQIELALANTHADSNSDPISLLKTRSEIQRQLRQPLGLSLAV
jgi:DNA primase